MKATYTLVNEVASLAFYANLIILSRHRESNFMKTSLVSGSFVEKLKGPFACHNNEQLSWNFFKKIEMKNVAL